MNPDERFEERLRELARTGSLRTGSADDPTVAWKREILAVAMEKTSIPRRLAPPRPLLYAWAAAWTAIAYLSWSGAGQSDTETSVATAPESPFSLLLANRSELLQQLDLP